MGANQICGPNQVKNNIVNSHLVTLSPKKLATQAELVNTQIWYCEFPEETQRQETLVQRYSHLLPEALHEAHSGRKAEYIAGRLAAQFALAEYGIEDYNLVSNPDRSPQWPDGIRGSITHKKSLAVAAVSNSIDFLGIDLETPMTEHAAHKLSRRIINDSEKQLLLSSQITFEDGFARVFSAKEALYKAVYPWVKRYLPFSVCEVTQISTDRLTLQLQPQLADELQYPTPFVVHTLMHNKQFLSLLISNR